MWLGIKNHLSVYFPQTTHGLLPAQYLPTALDKNNATMLEREKMLTIKQSF